jgi:Protein of unknown function (DUF2971)
MIRGKLVTNIDINIPNEKLVYHYCSTSVFYSIVSSKRLRLGAMTLSNDSEEGRQVEKILRESFPNLQSEGARALMEFASFWPLLRPSFAICFSKVGNLLGQWRAYADDGRGIALGFDRESLLDAANKRSPAGDETKFILEDIEYEVEKHRNVAQKVNAQMIEMERKVAKTDQLEKAIRDATDDQERLRFQTELSMDRCYSGKSVRGFEGVMSLYPKVFLLKHPGFSEEREVRLLCERAAANQAVDFHVSTSGMLKTYISLDVDDLLNRSLRAVVLGPKNATPVDVLHQFLHRYVPVDGNAIEIIRSDLPYR